MTTLSPRARLRRALTDDAARRSSPITVAPIARSATVMRRRFNPVMLNGPLRLTDDQLTAVLRATETPSYRTSLRPSEAKSSATGRCIG